MFKFIRKDSFIFGFILGLIAPFIGFIVFKASKLQTLNYLEALKFIYYEPSHRMLSVALSLCLLANAVLFTFYINGHIDKTAKGIFTATLLYGLVILCIKTFG
jgi:hypothetical protein